MCDILGPASSCFFFSFTTFFLFLFSVFFTAVLVIFLPLIFTFFAVILLMCKLHIYMEKTVGGTSKATRLVYKKENSTHPFVFIFFPFFAFIIFIFLLLNIFTFLVYRLRLFHLTQ